MAKDTVDFYVVDVKNLPGGVALPKLTHKLVKDPATRALKVPYRKESLGHLLGRPQKTTLTTCEEMGWAFVESLDEGASTTLAAYNHNRMLTGTCTLTRTAGGSCTVAPNSEREP